jgi:hypothetical protein
MQAYLHIGVPKKLCLFSPIHYILHSKAMPYWQVEWGTVEYESGDKSIHVPCDSYLGCSMATGGVNGDTVGSKFGNVLRVIVLLKDCMTFLQLQGL